MSKQRDNFALTNSVCILTDKDSSNLTRQDLIKVILQEQIERITFHYTALDGRLKEMKIPLESLKHTESVLADGERLDGSSIFKGLVDTGNSDMYIVPDYTTAFLNPFEYGSIDFICRFITPEGELAPFAPDNILQKASALLQKNSGYQLNALGELEFFLLHEPENIYYSVPKQKGYHNSSPFAKTSEILNEMLSLITMVTGNVKYGHYEVGCQDIINSDSIEINGKRVEQGEIEFLPSPIEKAGDSLVLARWIIRNVAYRNGMIATFAPKLDEGLAGNGMHIHMALKKNGKNQMVNGKGDLSKEAKKVIGGLCTYADSLTAFGNTVSGSYLRLVPNQEAPTNVCWSDRNRSTLIRVPLGWGKGNNLAQKINPQQQEPYEIKSSRQTVELRSPDGSANAHLLLAGIALAVDWGVSSPESLEIADNHYVTGNVHQDKAIISKLQSLPTSCSESAKILLMHRKLYERDDIFPHSIISYIANQLQAENDDNLNKRLLDLLFEERLAESRRIMHKDLHKH
ncbi:MAG: L-glutamine synthetase [Ignavibacteria bacterium]|nr:L-glutamine synthetase [Ignavibacteria bacterium]